MRSLRNTIFSLLLLLISSACFAAGTAEMSYDVIVVGGGGSGATAALTAAEAGAKVLLLEKTGKMHGTSLFTDGMTGIGTSLQKEKGINVTVNDVFKELNEFTHSFGNQKLQKEILSNSASTIDWLMSHGVKFYMSDNPEQLLHADKPNVYHMWKGEQGMGVLAKSLEDNKNATVMYYTAGKKLLVDNDNNIIGVQATNEEGDTVNFYSKAVILATGGFIGNQKMLDTEKIIGYPLSWRFNTGDGLRMAWAEGAQKFKADITLYHATMITTRDNRMSPFIGGLAPFIHIPILWVDKEGKRYYNEEEVYDNALVANALVSVGGTGYVVFDQAMVDKFKVAKTGLHDSFANISVERVIPGGQSGPLPNVQSDLDGAAKEGAVIKADTLEQLAVKTGFDKEAFVKQVADYNRYVKSGDDEQFAKPSEYLKYNVQKGPFYALEVKVVNLATMGGLKVNEKLETLDINNKPIKGLYSVGNTSQSNMYSDGYPVIEGLALCYATVSGHLAGAHSAAYVKSLR